MVFLASALALAGVAADPHRRFYERYFVVPQAVNGWTFFVYAASVGILMLVGSAAAYVITRHFTLSAWLAAAAAGFFLSEKLADEILRFRLFERKFTAWGRTNAARNGLQLVVFVACILLSGSDPSLPVVLALMALANCAVLVPQLPRQVAIACSPSKLRTLAFLGRKAVVSLIMNRRLWFMAILTSAIGYLDRLVALVIDKASLPLFMLVVMCFSLIGMAVDYYYVSRHRREFLEGRISALAAVSSRGFSASFLTGLALAAIACMLVLRFSRNGAEFPLYYVLVIAGFQAAVTVASIFREILYWTEANGRIVLVELMFWGVFGAALLAARTLGMGAESGFAIAVGCAVLRLAAYLVFALRAARPVPVGSP